MNRARKVGILIASALSVLGLVGSLMTQGVMEHLPFLHSQKTGLSGVEIPHGIVDQRPWQTAATLATLAVSSEERDLAREAERLADHEVDQAFSQSLRQASAAPKELKGKALALQLRVTELHQTVKDDQARVVVLTRSGGPVDTVPRTEDDLSVAKAQLDLDQNQLSDLTEDLARESGDQRITIQRELSTRKAEMTKYAAETRRGEGQTAVTSAEQYNTFAGQIKEWWAQRNRRQLIEQAWGLAKADVAALTEDQARLETEANAAETGASISKPAGESSADRVERLQHLADQRNILSILNDRLGTQQQLVALYEKWDKQVELQHRMLLHLMLQSLTAIGVIFLATMLLGWGLQVAFNRIWRDRRQQQTLRTIVNLGTQLIGLLLVLLVIFGVPQQTPTILGLATAGLTVVFQDFILAFCGWFVLMGPNGIRTGDWVEIDGVGGEAIEIGLFRTWLLETGNWTANGHPTGRRVSFLNGYAIRGKYFNFSTTGQWMWDEIKVNIPAGTEIYPLIEKIRAAAVKATEVDAKMAQEEWKRVTHEQGAPHFSATPSVDMRPAGAGVDIVVRYVTRAGARLETRNRLFETALKLMQGSREGGSEISKS
jgi:small-conductance mechanosensitive channel